MDEHEKTRDDLSRFFKRKGYGVVACGGAEEALRRLSGGRFDLVFADGRATGMTGLKLLDEIAARGGGEAVVLVSAFATVEEGVEAMRRGAWDYLVKPFKFGHLARVVERVLEARRRAAGPQAAVGAEGTAGMGGGRESVGSGNAPAAEESSFSTPLVGNSPAVSQLLNIISRVAPTDSSVLVTGATGTGKELVARAIHERSGRRGAQFVDINCSAIPDTLIEAELFGHERGTFTGAHETRGGLFEKASGGTLFLDEVDALCPGAQVKLLRVLQERCVRRVGGRQNIPVDVRIISATNRDLQQAIADGKFRVDLFYRLCVVPLQLPELRERGEDVELLAKYFLGQRRQPLGDTPRRFTPEALRALSAYDWPGNVRELENAVEYALAVGVGEEIGTEDLPPEVVGGRRGAGRLLEQCVLDSATLAEVERRYVLHVFERHGGHQTKTAAALGIDRRTLYNKLRQYGILSYERGGLRALAN